MKKTVLLLALSLMIASIGFAQLLGPANYQAAESNDQASVIKPKPISGNNYADEYVASSLTKPKANISYNDEFVSYTSSCESTGTCIIDYPRPIDNGMMRSSNTVILSKAQINVQSLPVVYLNSTAASVKGPDIPYRCTIVLRSDESPSSARKHRKMFCEALDNGGLGN